ncbi:ABC transporter ATP-binding protein [Candidatus Saccharibacteria bacterium]|nr:ABC transporter ATP-binding protein [Candidatus Saccharibacteria bacterium]
MGTNRRTLQLYWQSIRRHKTSFFLALIAVPAASLLLDTLLPYYFSQAIGALSAGRQADVNHFLWIAGGIGIGGFLLNFIGFKALVHHEADVRVDLSNNIFHRLINKDAAFFANEKVGSLTSNFIGFIRSHVGLQDLLIIRTLGFTISVVTGLTLVATQSLMLAGIILLLIAALLVQVRISLNIRRPLRQARKKMQSEIHGKVADAISNSLAVKTFAREDAEEKELHAANLAYRSVYVKDFNLLSTEGSLRLLLMVTAQIIAISYCANLYFQGQMNIETVIFTLTYLQRIASQIFTLGEILNGYDQHLLEAAPMTEHLQKPDVVTDRPGARTLGSFEPVIEFADVAYRYEADTEDVLRATNLTIPAGQKVGLVGHSGAGKSTITRLLLRFADVTDGAIRLGGRDLRDITQVSLREHIAYVPQEPLLFHRSLRDNIAYGKPGASTKQIREAARKANALEFIEQLPQGFATIVGERGVKLSGGQRQRIAIARAILKDAPVLVLDEATSALDSESERLIQDALHELMRGRTTIVIAHRLSTIAGLDRILVLENGSIIEDGSHEQLLKQRGTYATLWAHQSGGFIED